MSVYLPGRPSAGLSLIEVLVALLLVSVGILALLGLMNTASRLGKTSEFRSVASLLAADLADRIRANGEAADQGLYNLTPSTLARARVSPPGSLCVAVCTPAQLAALDLAQWQATVFNSLPRGTGYLHFDSTTQGGDLWLMWRDPSAMDDDAKTLLDAAALASQCPPGFALQPRPSCIYIRVSR